MPRLSRRRSKLPRGPPRRGPRPREKMGGEAGGGGGRGGWFPLFFSAAAGGAGGGGGGGRIRGGGGGGGKFVSPNGSEPKASDGHPFRRCRNWSTETARITRTPVTRYW